MNVSNIARGSIVLLLFASSACSGSEEAHAPAPPSVGVVTVHASDVPVELSLRGRVTASRTAEVRARATGVVLERVFEEGQEVQEGDVLFRIDPRPMRAALAQARAEPQLAARSLGFPGEPG